VKCFVIAKGVEGSDLGLIWGTSSTFLRWAEIRVMVKYRVGDINRVPLEYKSESFVDTAIVPG
jgi:hypothetical protein